MDLRIIRNKITETKTLKGNLEREITDLNQEITDLNEYGLNLIKAREIVASTILVTQTKVVSYINEVACLGLHSVFGERYNFEFRKRIQNNVPQLQPVLIKNGKDRTNLKEDSGYGVLDVLSMVLLLTVWSIAFKKTRPIMFLDETAKYIHGKEIAYKTSEMIKKISESMGVQIILISCDDLLRSAADKVFFVWQVNKEETFVEEEQMALSQ